MIRRLTDESDQSGRQGRSISGGSGQLAAGKRPGYSADLERLRRNLRFARQQVLTKRQQQMLELYYDQGLTMGQIAAKLHLNRSTVCRTLQRARERLYACLRYTL